MMNSFENTKNTQGPSSTAAAADAINEELRRTTEAEEKNIEEYIQEMSKLTKVMIETTLLQKNVNKTIKEDFRSCKNLWTPL